MKAINYNQENDVNSLNFWFRKKKIIEHVTYKKKKKTVDVRFRMYCSRLCKSMSKRK